MATTGGHGNDWGSGVHRQQRGRQQTEPQVKRNATSSQYGPRRWVKHSECHLIRTVRKYFSRSHVHDIGHSSRNTLEALVEPVGLRTAHLNEFTSTVHHVATRIEATSPPPPLSRPRRPLARSGPAGVTRGSPADPNRRKVAEATLG